MGTKQKIYVAREYVLTDEYGGMRIDEEAVFATFEDARTFVNTLRDKEATGDYLLSFRIEILEYEVGRTESCLKRWTYNIKGELLDTYDDLNYTQDPDYLNYTGRYKVGNIVYIPPNIRHKLSPSTKGTYGVVAEVSLEPRVYSLFDGNGEECGEEVCREYTIYYIAEDGLLDHWHIVESALSMPEEGVPNEFKFLELLSKHFKNEIELPEDLLEQVFNENVSVLNTRTFDFHSGTIRESFVEEKGLYS